MSTQTKDRPGLSWEEICQDPRFRDLPYKIETNARGQIIMSPTYQYHGAAQAEIAGLIREALSGRVVTESAIATSDGKKIADVAWFSEERWERVKDALDAPIAPEIAVEVYSPGNTEEELAHKRRLYFEAGADEVWICDQEGILTFYNETGEIEVSDRISSFPHEIDL
ncbi:MAG: Uma2 family endonuclease [Salinibacter sp.]